MLTNSLALYLRGWHEGGRGGAEFALVLLGLGFAALLVWIIERSGRRTV
jgi:hypothetical protein